MSGTMTWVGLDVHARSMHAAAIDVMTGELTRVRFGAGLEAPVAWLAGLPGPVRACYEAGPTGFGLYRAAVAAGVGMQVIAPGKTPRGPSDRVKTDRKDAELLARLLLAGSLTRVVVPPPEIEAAREMTRAHDACRRDLMNARHRVSKMLLRHGRVYPKPTTWTAEHRRWLSRQQFDEPASSLVFADLLASVDGLTARKQAIALRLSERAPAGLLPLGGRHRRLIGLTAPLAGGPGRRAISGRHARLSYEQRPLRRPSRSFLDSESRQHETGPWGHQIPASSDWQRRHRARRPGPPTTPSRRPTSRRDHPRPLDNHTGHISSAPGVPRRR